MHQLIDRFEQNYSELYRLSQNNLSRELRLFNIRFRLGIDIIIDFGGKTSLTKTSDVRNTYKLIIQLMETWNSYEAMVHYIRSCGRYQMSNDSIFLTFSQTLLNTYGCLSILNDGINEIHSKYNQNNVFKRDFNQYIGRIQQDTRIRQRLTEYCTKVKNYFEGTDTVSGIELLALIYAERNLYYHNGETAKMGMEYHNRQFLIRTYLDSISRYILTFINGILENEILIISTNSN